MKTLGLIGGVGWETTALYYQRLNAAVRVRLGGLHTARVIVHSLEFQSVQSLIKTGRWNEVGAVLAAAGKSLQAAGADAVLLCSDQLHYVAGYIEAALDIPLLHVGDAILHTLRREQIRQVGLLATRFTLEHSFLLDRRSAAKRAAPVKVFTPDPLDMGRLDRIIFSEVCQGRIREQSRAELRLMARLLQDRGVQALLVAATEVSAVLRREDVALPLFDSAQLHVDAAVTWALADIEWTAGLGLVTPPAKQSNPPRATSVAAGR